MNLGDRSEELQRAGEIGHLKRLLRSERIQSYGYHYEARAYIRDYPPFEVLYAHDDTDPRFPLPRRLEEPQELLDEVVRLGALQLVEPVEVRDICGCLERRLREAMG